MERKTDRKKNHERERYMERDREREGLQLRKIRNSQVQIVSPCIHTIVSMIRIHALKM